MNMPGMISESRIRTVCLVFLAAVAATYLIYWLRPVLVPLVVACFVVSGVSPILATLERRLGVKRIVAAGLTFLAGVIVLIVFGFSIWVSVLDVSRNAGDYRQRVRVLVLEIGDLLPAGFLRHDRETHSGPLKNLPLKEGTNSEEPTEKTEPTERESTESSGEQPGDQVVEQNVNAESDEQAESVEQEPASIDATVPSGEPSSNALVIDHDSIADQKAQAKLDRASELVDSVLRDAIASLSQTLLGLVSTSVVVLIYVFFLLLGTPSVAQSPAVREIDTQVRSYLSVKTVISIFTGLAFGITLRLFGVPMAFTFGVLAFLLNFVPNVGPLVASLLPIPLIILDPTGSVGWMVATIVAISTIQMVSGNVIEPKIMGDSSGLHPVTILVALMFWGMMWGVIGMFLATPITAALKIMLERFESTRFISELMAGRWQGTPSETSASIAT
jgi:AI-2 transport protein TqsA